MPKLIRLLQNQLSLSDGQLLLMAREAAENGALISTAHLTQDARMILILMLMDVFEMRHGNEKRKSTRARRVDAQRVA